MTPIQIRNFGGDYHEFIKGYLIRKCYNVIEKYGKIYIIQDGMMYEIYWDVLEDEISILIEFKEV